MKEDMKFHSHKDYYHPQLKLRKVKTDLPACPNLIPKELFNGHETQALLNHGQSLDRLNERGGCDPTEIYAILNNISLKQVPDLIECINFIVNKIEKLNKVKLD